MQEKLGLVVGVANKRSIAWAIAQRVCQQGARLALTYQNERLGENVFELAATLENSLVLHMDVSFDDQVEAAFARIRDEWARLDFLVHAIPHAPKQDLLGEFVATSREGSRIAQEVSSYSLTQLARAARPLMSAQGGSIVALTYLGGERVVPHYNVMGVAKAALESSVRYLAFDLGPENIRVN